MWRYMDMKMNNTPTFRLMKKGKNIGLYQNFRWIQRKRKWSFEGICESLDEIVEGQFKFSWQSEKNLSVQKPWMDPSRIRKQREEFDLWIQ